MVLSDVKKKEVESWVQKHLTKTQAKTVTKVIAEVKELAQTNVPEEPARMEALRKALIDHGLPVVLAARVDKEMAYKILAALHVKSTD